MDSSIKCKKTDRENFIRKNRYLVMFLTILIFLMVNGFAQAKSIKILMIILEILLYQIYQKHTVHNWLLKKLIQVVELMEIDSN